MPATTRQMAEIAGVSEQTVRNYTRRYGELLSPQARGETGARLFDDQDVQVFCSIAAMYRANMPPQEIIERVKGGDVFVDHTTPQQATPNATQSQKTALDASQAPIVVYADLQRQIDALKQSRNKQLWSHATAFYLGMVTMGIAFWLTWILNNWWYR